MQWNATGNDTANAVAPDQRWMGATYDGAPVTPGSRPHIHSAVASCTRTRTATAVVSQAFIWSMPLKPSVKIGRPAGECSCAYTPRLTATSAPTSNAPAAVTLSRSPFLSAVTAPERHPLASILGEAVGRGKVSDEASETGARLD